MPRVTQRKGDIAVARTVAAFTEMGYDVAIPLTESAAYDLIVDADGTLARVQVRYCDSDDGEVGLRRIHSNSTGYVVKKAQPGSYDWLVVLWRGQLYITKQCLAGRASVLVSKLVRLEACG